MSNLEYVQKLMGELGPLVDEIGLIQQLGDDLWLVVFNDETSVQMECDETGNKIVFSMNVGKVEGERRQEIYESLLAYNLLYHDTAGMRMALDGSEGNVVLLLDLCHLDLQVSTMAAFLEVFVETGLSWREVLQGADTVGGATKENEDFSGALQA